MHYRRFVAPVVALAIATLTITLEAGSQPARARRAMVVSQSDVASEVGWKVMRDGGNAIDATLAMAAAGWMALPGQCGIGGDAFVVVREPDGRVWTVNGSGFGADGASADFFRDRGDTAIPLGGALSVAVPGARPSAEARTGGPA